MKKINFFIAALCLIPFLSFSQSPSTNEKEIIDVVYSITDTYKNLPKTKNKDKMASFFTRDYTIDRVRINVGEKIEVQENNIFDLEKLMNIITETQNMEVDYRVDSILRVYASPLLGYVTFDASYDIKRDGQHYISGTETITYFFQKINNEWKVVKGHSVQVRNTISRATCNASVYKSEAADNTYIVQTEMPTDNSFVKKLNSFSFDKLQNGLRTIDVDGAKYSWSENGIITILSGNAYSTINQSGREIGSAKKPIDAISLILKEDMYQKHCIAIKILK